MLTGVHTLFQYYKKRADDIKIFRSLPGSLQVKVASYQYSEVVLRNRQLFRGCNGQFLNQVRFCRYRSCATGELKYRGAVG